MDDLEQQEEEKPETKKEVKDEGLAQFKNPQELLKAYKELQGAFTRTSQENKLLKQMEAELQEMKERMKLTQASQVPPQMPGNFEEQYLDNPQQAIQEAVLFSRITEVLEDEQEKIPEEFQERYAYAQRVVTQYPNLSKSARGIKKAFELGDKLRKDMLKQSTSMALESVFGEPLSDEEITRLRKLVKGDKVVNETKSNSNAYMPDTSTSTRKSDTRSEPDADDKIRSAAKKGDVDGVLNTMFRDMMAQ